MPFFRVMLVHEVRPANFSTSPLRPPSLNSSTFMVISIPMHSEKPPAMAPSRFAAPNEGAASVDSRSWMMKLWLSSGSPRSAVMLTFAIVLSSNSHGAGFIDLQRVIDKAETQNNEFERLRRSDSDFREQPA